MQREKEELSACGMAAGGALPPHTPKKDIATALGAQEPLSSQQPHGDQPGFIWEAFTGEPLVLQKQRPHTSHPPAFTCLTKKPPLLRAVSLLGAAHQHVLLSATPAQRKA